jgi:hypothetical protein
MKPLWEITRDLHHACEEHPVGAAMIAGRRINDYILPSMLYNAC